MLPSFDDDDDDDDDSSSSTTNTTNTQFSSRLSEVQESDVRSLSAEGNSEANIQLNVETVFTSTTDSSTVTTDSTTEATESTSASTVSNDNNEIAGFTSVNPLNLFTVRIVYFYQSFIFFSLTYKNFCRKGSFIRESLPHQEEPHSIKGLLECFISSTSSIIGTFQKLDNWNDYVLFIDNKPLIKQCVNFFLWLITVFIM